MKFRPAELAPRSVQSFYLRLVTEPLYVELATGVAFSALALVSRDIARVDKF